MALAADGDWLDADMPAELYTILRNNNRLDDLLKTGHMEPYLEYCRQDWCFRKEFSVSQEDLGRKCRLCFQGVDTFADIYLNGEKIATCRDIFMPARIFVTGRLKRDNVLCVYFHSPTEWIEAQEVPAKYGAMSKAHLQRIDSAGFSCYFGARPYNRPMGLYGSITLELFDTAWLEMPDIRTYVSPDLAEACLEASSAIIGNLEGVTAAAVLYAPDGARMTSAETASGADGCWQVSLTVDSPLLWWPVGYGEHPLYRLKITLKKGGAVLDEFECETGFRRVAMEGDLSFKINGAKVKLWGSNFAPLHAHDYSFDRAKCLAVLDWAEFANMNSLRVWGGGVPYDDELYREADRRGILLWQDFFHDWGIYPGSDEFRAMCKSEAEDMVRRLKHHPSILLWCGGNECYQGSEADANTRFVGWEVFEIDYPEVVRRLDPSRHYHPNSPYGGDYANDPTSGDSHVYSHIWFNRGFDYPIFQTENCRVFAPHIRSLKKMLGEENLWTEGFTAQLLEPGDTLFPPSWHERALLPDYIPRLPPVERFYDANGPEALIYRLGAAHAWHMRDVIERARRGRPASDAFGPRRTQGHFVWRLFDTWPEIFCSLLDYYMEPYIPLYAIRRAFSPILISFEITDRIYAWIVNDSLQAVEGELRIVLFDPEENRCTDEMRVPVKVFPCESAPVCSLDRFGEFRRKTFLYSELTASDGHLLAKTNDFLDIERKLFFPDAALQFVREGERLFLRSDAFARCVELSAVSEAGDEFGWSFEDNYFDLFPWEKKEIIIRGKRKPAHITATSRFSSDAAHTL